VVFDKNPPQPTTKVYHVIDGDAPWSEIREVTWESPFVSLEWTGGDGEKGSGVASYTIYASRDGEPFLPVISRTSATSGMFKTRSGHTYEFYSVAADLAGNREEQPLDADGNPVAEIEIRLEDHFRRGDANADGTVDISDAQSILGFLFLGYQAPSCRDAADADDNSRLEITDGIYLLSFLFLGGPAPPAPGPDSCGPDPTPDDLQACEYAPDLCP
jgi:hypothetical protein